MTTHANARDHGANVLTITFADGSCADWFNLTDEQVDAITQWLEENIRPVDSVGP